MVVVGAALAMQLCCTLACAIMRPNVNWFLNTLEVGMGLLDMTKLSLLVVAYSRLARQAVISATVDSLGSGWLAAVRQMASNLMEQLTSLNALDRACMSTTLVQVVVLVLMGLWVMQVTVAALAHALVERCSQSAARQQKAPGA